MALPSHRMVVSPFHPTLTRGVAMNENSVTIDVTGIKLITLLQALECKSY